MPLLTKLGYWAGSGTREDPYKPDYAVRYPLTGFNTHGGGVADGIVIGIFDGTTQAIADITADAGVIPDSAKLPVPEPSVLIMPLNPIDLRTAASDLVNGDTLALAQGIYTLSAAEFSPPANTTLRAADGARVVITDVDGGPPNLSLNNGVMLRGLWLGGTKGANEHAVEVGSDCVIDGCVLFNYRQGIGEGSGARNVYTDNVFVNCGVAPHSHGLYIAGDQSVAGLRKDARVTGNLFLSCPSYALHLYHNPTHVTMERNLFARCNWALVDEGAGHLVRDNVFWSSTSLLLNALGDDTVFSGNVIGYLNGTLGTPATMAGNKYVWRAVSAGDSAPVRWTFGDARAALGRSYLQIEEALDAVVSRFAAFDATDSTTDAYLDVLRGLVT
jgi:hypothetical protein